MLPAEQLVRQLLLQRRYLLVLGQALRTVRVQGAKL